MPIPKKVQSYLEKNKVRFSHIPHRTVYTAYDAAQTLRRALDQIAKNVLVKTNVGWAIIIVPSNRNLDFKKLKAVMQRAGDAVTSIKIPDEKVMTKLLGIKPGALPAFGSLHNIRVYLDRAMMRTKKAIFATGSFEDSVEMVVKDFATLEHAVVGAFSVPKKLPKLSRPVKVKKSARRPTKKVKKAKKRR